MAEHDEGPSKVRRAPRANTDNRITVPPPPREPEFSLDIDDIELATVPVPATMATTPPRRESLFGDLALGDEEIDALFGSLSEGPPSDLPPALDIAPPDEFLFRGLQAPSLAPPSAVTSGARDDADDADAIEVEADDDAEMTIEAGDDFVEVDAVVDVDRGAALAASVTSRRRDDGDLDAPYVVDAVGEARARAELLLSEAALAADFPEAARRHAFAADLLDGVLGHGARAEQSCERARALAPEVPLGLRLQRRMLLARERVSGVAALFAEELTGSLGDDERAALRWAHAFAALATDVDLARGVWHDVARGAVGLSAALASLLEAAAGRDGAGIESSLASWGSVASPVVAAGIQLARARVSEIQGAASALSVARAAVKGEAGDFGAWLTLARVAANAASTTDLEDAVAGIRSLAGGGLLEGACELVSGALAAVTSGVAKPVAERDDSSSWGAVAAARRAFREGDPSTAAVLLEGETAAARAGLAACAGGIVAAEVDALRNVSESTDPWLAFGLGAAASAAFDAAAVPPDPQWRAAYAVCGETFVSSSGTGAAAIARAGDDEPAFRWFAAHRAERTAPASVTGSLERAEASSGDDGARSSALLLLAAATAGEGGPLEMDVAELRRLLPGELAVAELAVQHARSGTVSEVDAAAALDEVRGEGAAAQVSAVRAALRRAEVDPVVAADTLWDRWGAARADACLATLVLRSPGYALGRASDVLRAGFESAVERREPGAFGVALGHVAADVLASTGATDEALAVLARARAVAPGDALLADADAVLRLALGRANEVSERLLERLKRVDDASAKVAVYERLGRIELGLRNDVAAAAPSFAAILERDPHHAEALRALERHYAEREQWEPLFRVLHRVASDATEPADRLTAVHAAFRAARRADDAARDSARVLRWETFDRGIHDRRLLLDLDADARLERDWAHTERLARALAARAVDAAERAAHLVRAASCSEALGDPARAAEAFAAALAARPRLDAYLGSARVADARGDRTAALTFRELGAKEMFDPGLASERLYALACAWRDEIGDPVRALDAVVEGLRRDPAHGPSFGLALGLLEHAPDPVLELELVTSFLDVAAQDLSNADAVRVYTRGAAAAEAAGDLDRARALYRGVTEIDGANLAALRAQVRLADVASDWSASADARIRLAKSTTDGGERLELLLQLGDLFDERLGDPKRAEAAWRRVAQGVATDPRAWERLAGLYERTNDASKEAEVRRVLAQRARTAAERATHGLRLVTLFKTVLADEALADEALRLCAEDVRAGVDRNVHDEAAFGRLATWHHLRGAKDAERVLAAAAVTVGVATEELRALAPDGVVPGAGAECLNAGALDLLAPPALPPDLRELIVRAAPVLDAVAPFDAVAAKAEPLGAQPHPLRSELERWAKVLGVGDVEIFVTADLPAVALPLSRHPPQVLVAAGVHASIATQFAAARAMVLLALGLGVPMRGGPAALALSLSALLRQFEPMFRADGVDPERLDALSRAVTRTLPRTLQTELATAARTVLKRPFDAALVHGATLEFGDRVALLATGDLPAAVAALAPPGVAPGRVIDEVPSAGRLVRVSLSERFLEARRLCGVPRD